MVAMRHRASPNPLPWLIGGGAALTVLAVVLVRRALAKSATPQSAPDQSPLALPETVAVVPPVPTPAVAVQHAPAVQRPPTQTPPRPAPLPTIVRQPSLTASSASSAAAIRILQHQLQSLGYTITRIDGRPGPELSQATLSFENDAGMDHFASNLELLLAVDAWYGHVFDPMNRGVA